MKKIIKKVPILGDLARNIYRNIKAKRNGKQFPGSASYWDERYQMGGNSGVGSYTKFSSFKAEVINSFISDHDIQSVIEFGCGDGNQLRFFKQISYIGFDVSSTAVSLCKNIFASDNSKIFRLMSEYRGEKADLSLSLDVLYHLVEDDIFENYMRKLFKASERYVIIYSSNFDGKIGSKTAHIKHRKFTKYIQENLNSWKLIKHMPNQYPYKGDYKDGSFADFFIYEKA